MGVYKVRKGRDIRLKGSAEKNIIDSGIPAQVAIKPLDVRGLRPRLLVRVDDKVKVGTPVIEGKTHPDFKLVSPASGKVVAINRGEKRALEEIVIETDGKQEALEGESYSEDQIKKLERYQIVETLLESGAWACIRQRPFSHIAFPEHTPKSIFIQAINTEPLSLDIDAVLPGREDEFQLGLRIIKKLTDGDVHLCCHKDAKSKALTLSKYVKIHQFSGPHPAGNVSTLIHRVDPINKGEFVWYIRAEDVLRIASVFLKGHMSPERFVAITGEGARNRVYQKTIMGASLKDLLDKDNCAGMRCISGSVLAGKDVGAGGFLGFYDSQITIIPEGGNREFMGWINPGLNKYSFSRTFLSSLRNLQEVSLDTDKNGSDRAIVLNHLYDDYVPLDIPTYFLLKAILAEDIEEAERLGILECDEEDFALCSFACPSKTDVGGIIRQGLEFIEQEG